MNISEAKQFIADEGGYAYLKYVRFQDDTILFADATSYSGKNHNALVSEHPDSPVKSAAMFKIRDGKLRLEGYSMMLKIGPAPDDSDFIGNILGLAQSGWEEWS